MLAVRSLGRLALQVYICNYICNSAAAASWVAVALLVRGVPVSRVRPVDPRPISAQSVAARCMTKLEQWRLDHACCLADLPAIAGAKAGDVHVCSTCGDTWGVGIFIVSEREVSRYLRRGTRRFEPRDGELVNSSFAGVHLVGWILTP